MRKKCEISSEYQRGYCAIYPEHMMGQDLMVR